MVIENLSYSQTLETWSVIMTKQKTALQELDEKAEKERNNPDKRDAAEKLPTGEVLHQSTKGPYNHEENPGDEGPNTSVPAGKNPDKPAK